MQGSVDFFLRRATIIGQNRQGTATTPAISASVPNIHRLHGRPHLPGLFMLYLAYWNNYLLPRWEALRGLATLTRYIKGKKDIRFSFRAYSVHIFTSPASWVCAYRAFLVNLKLWNFLEVFSKSKKFKKYKN